MQYKIRRVNPPGRDALEHGLFGNKGGAKLGSTWDNHLYIARQKMANGWRYFYSQAELRAAQAKQAGGQLKRNATAAAKSGVASAKRAVRNAPDNIRSGISSARNSIRSTASSAKTSAGNALNSARTTAAKAKNVLSGQYAKDVDKRYNDSQTTVESTYDDGKRMQTTTVHDQEAYDKAVKDSQKLTYKISDGINRTLSAVKDSSTKGKDFLDRAINSGKDKASSAVDKAREAASKAADKAQAAADKAMKAAEDARKVAEEAVNRAKAAIPETKAKEEAPKPVEKKSQPEPAQKQESSYPKKPDNVSEEYWEELHGPDPNKKSDNQASKPMDIKKASDEYIEDLYSNSKKNDGSGVSPELELEYNYRQASNQAEYLGRVTDTKSDAAEAALKKYGRDSQQYKKAYDEMEEAFDQLHEAEDLLKRYERERNK